MALISRVAPARPISPRMRLRSFLSIGICAVFMTTCLAPLMPSARGDPTEITNVDGNREIHWNYSDPVNYTVSNATVSGGHARLAWLDKTQVDDTKAEFDQSLVKQNIDTSMYPGSVVLGYVPPVVQTYVIQPGPASSRDTYISQESPANNYGTANILDFNSQSNKQKRPLMYFDLASIPSNATIVNATLWLWVKAGQNAAFDFTVHTLNVSYDESNADWTHYSASGLWSAPGGDYSTTSYLGGQLTNTVGWHGYELGGLVEHWVRGEVQNYGFTFIATTSTGTNTDKQVISSDDASNPTRWPMLRVNYTLATGPGRIESRVLGPGTNSLFSQVNWSASVASLATDEFSGPSLNQRWSWMRDPRTMGGSFDVGVTRAGWLRLVGGQSTYSNTVVLKSNYLYQNITGDFSAKTHMEEQFTTNSMAAGMVLMYDMHNWVSIVKYGSGSSAKLWVSAYYDDVGISGPQQSWSNNPVAYFGIDKTSDGAIVNYSTDGVTWTTIYTYVPTHEFVGQAMLGLEVYSSTTDYPVVLFDYFRIDPFSSTTSLVVKTRLGNSTNLSHPSWTSWSSPLISGTSLDQTAKYAQYSVDFLSACSWVSPIFSAMRIETHCYASDGEVATLDISLPLVKRWISLWTFEQLNGGTVVYNYSTDHGAHWTDLVNGAPNSLTSTSPSMIVRAFMHTDDTLRSPRLDIINATYAMSPAFFYIVVPTRVQAGAPFQVLVAAKDEDNRTIPWTGDVTLQAMDSSGMSPASSLLDLTTMHISSAGWSVLPNERYFTAETIRISAVSGTAFGFSYPLTVTPGPPGGVTIIPTASSMVENTSRNFTVVAHDQYGNVNTTASFTWSADASLGTLNTTSGAHVRLTVGHQSTDGNLTVHTSMFTASIHIDVSAKRFPPVILPIPRQVRDEDSGFWTLDLTAYISDPDDDTALLRYRVSNESIISVIEGPDPFELTFGTLPDLNGINNLDLVVTDPDGQGARAVIVVEIRPVNDAPTINSIDPLVVHYGVPYTYSLRTYVHDVDTPLNSLLLTVDPASVPYVLVDGLTLTFLYPQSMNGMTKLVKVTVSDGNLVASTTIQVTVSSDQVPILTEALPDVTLDQGSSIINAFDLDNHFTDPDLEVLFYAFGNAHVRIVIQMNHTVDFYAPNDWSGVEYVTFRASDSRGARVECTITVTVISVNQPPRIANVPDLVVHFDLQFDFDLAPYITDLDGDKEVRTITTDDPFIMVNRTVMSLLYPMSMNGMRVPVNITVHDTDLYDWWIINVTISDNQPPMLVGMMPDHTFLEDSPVDYPVGTSLADYFADFEGSPLRFEAFISTSNMTVETLLDNSSWVVRFTPELDYNGKSNLTIRAREMSTGGIVENTIRVTVIPVPDRPLLDLPHVVNVTEGQQSILDMAEMVRDPDSALSAMTFVVAGSLADLGHVAVQNDILVFEVPEGFIPDREKSVDVNITVTVYDDTGLSSNETIIVHIERKAAAVKNPLDPLLLVGMVAMAGAASGGFAFAMYRRKRPFVIRDMMLVHNDGFLISRFASPHRGEIDEDVLSGMLTAVLNFVEDSMSSSHDQLKTFGFKEYQVLVTRGKKTFVAIVYEGDAPEGVEKPVNEFLQKIERIYKKKIENWTGDIETDFAGASVLLEAFVKEHDMGHGKKGSRSIWTARKRPSAPGPK